jgi:hypothetical protein
MPAATLLITEKDLIEAYRLSYFSSLRSKGMIASAVFMTVVLAVAGYVLAWDRGLGIKILVALVFVAGWMILLGAIIAITNLRLPRTARKSFTQLKYLGAPIKAEWSADHISFEAANGSSRYQWGDFVKIAEGKSVFLLFQADNLFNVIPKANLSAAEIDSIRACLAHTRSA